MTFVMPSCTTSGALRRELPEFSFVATSGTLRRRDLRHSSSSRPPALCVVATSGTLRRRDLRHTSSLSSSRTLFTSLVTWSFFGDLNNDLIRDVERLFVSQKQHCLCVWRRVGSPACIDFGCTRLVLRGLIHDSGVTWLRDSATSGKTSCYCDSVTSGKTSGYCDSFALIGAASFASDGATTSGGLGFASGVNFFFRATTRVCPRPRHEIIVLRLSSSPASSCCVVHSALRLFVQPLRLLRCDFTV
ncbi:hypothetical protein H6P81_002969 [Aristolochia fimbriata]|uniref:Uncharacterized protein n=1 Tax=Aristolochia fimbriata TaxID=158543 RepID=A0AAV7FF44_ARIFI|nr:hypothetical protein H6P81_002969 [Aristolochia fimbriata]